MQETRYSQSTRDDNHSLKSEEEINRVENHNEARSKQKSTLKSFAEKRTNKIQLKKWKEKKKQQIKHSESKRDWKSLTRSPKKSITMQRRMYELSFEQIFEELLKLSRLLNANLKSEQKGTGISNRRQIFNRFFYKKTNI